jgi:hypothetical protein
MANIASRRFIVLLISIMIVHVINAQFKQFFIKDKQTNEPLAYASVVLLKENKVLYSDSIGKLYLEEKIIQQNDSIRISFINYIDRIITGQSLSTTNQILLQRSFNELKEVVVDDCKEEEIIRITNNYGSGRSSNGAGFDLPVKLLGYYPNETGKEGWIKSIEFYASRVKQPDAKLRLHWYEWDEAKQQPGKDLTDTSIIVAVNKNGWNEIKIPDHSIYVGEKGIVLGFDMLYTSDILKTYKEIKEDVEARKFRFAYNWFLGTDITDKKEGFNLHDDKFLYPSVFKKENIYHKPAIHINIKTCSQ